MNKIALITGSTSGIGWETAKKLSILNFDLIITGRNSKKIDENLLELEKLNSKGNYQGYCVDFASMCDVYKFTESVKKSFSRLDILINNAGAVYMKRTLTAEGLESTFAVNHLAPFLITRELMSLLEKSNEARIINVSSHSHYSGRLDFDDLQSEKKFSGIKQYANTKLMNILFTLSLNHKLNNKPIFPFSLHPGVVRTSIGYKNSPLWAALLWWLFTRFKGIPAEEGAKTSVFLATEPLSRLEIGGYYSNCKPKNPSTEARREDFAEKLWEISDNLVNCCTTQFQ